VDNPNSQATAGRPSYRRRANLGETVGEVDVDPLDTKLEKDALEREVLQILTRRQRAPPKGGYPFPKNDHVATKMGKLPPSPCKVCGSEKHWDKECPDYVTYEGTRKRTANLSIVANPGEEELENNYVSAYALLLDDKIRRHVELNELDLARSLPQDFLKAASTALERVKSHGA
jgi:hypothetical protein